MEIADKLITYFTHHGVPELIISDNGGEFRNAVVQELLETHKINLHFTSSQNPQSNGMIERLHSTLVEHIRLLNNEKAFDSDNIKTKIKYAILAYNHTIHTSTGHKPMDIITGHIKNRNPLDLDLNKRLLTNYVNEHTGRIQTLFKDIHEKMQKKKEHVINKANDNRENLLEIPQTIFVKTNRNKRRQRISTKKNRLQP